MGALGQFIDDLKDKIVELETERDMYKGRYEDLCAMLRKKANDDWNIEDEDILKNTIIKTEDI